MVDEQTAMSNDAHNWWWIRRFWDNVIVSPRNEAALRIEDVVYSETRWSLPAFQALVTEAESLRERQEVVEAYFQFLPWNLDTDGTVLAWLCDVASDEPELRDLITTLRDRL